MFTYIHTGGDEISWGNTVECENYIFLIQKAAEKLSSENRNLRKIHESLCELTIGLMQIDFLKQTEMWKLKWRTIKDKMNLVKNKYPSKDCKLWILHWDSQIYKALEVCGCVRVRFYYVMIIGTLPLTLFDFLIFFY